jgi:hypothetical protein
VGQLPPQLSLRALGEVRPFEAQRWELVLGQGKQLGEVLGPGDLGAVGGQILDVQERHFGFAGLALLGACLADFLNLFGDGAEELEPFGLGLQLAAELLGAAFSHRELSAVLTAVGTALEPGVVGLKLAIRRDQFPLDKPEGAKEAYKKHQGRLDGLRVHTAAEVAHIVLARNGGLQTGEIARVAALLLLAQIRTEAGIVGVVVHRLATSRKKDLAVL